MQEKFTRPFFVNYQKDMEETFRLSMDNVSTIPQ